MCSPEGSGGGPRPEGLCSLHPFLRGPQLSLQDAWPHWNRPTVRGQLAGKDGTKTHRLMRVVITANRHILSPRQVWGWQPLIITHPKTSAYPPSSSARLGTQLSSGQACWQPGQLGPLAGSLSSFCRMVAAFQKAWGELAPGLCPACWAGRGAAGVAGCPGQPEGAG